MWQLVQSQSIFLNMFFFSMKEIWEESQYCCVSKFDFTARCVCVFVFKSSLFFRLKPSACSPHSLCWSGPLGPPCPPTPCRGAPPLHPGSPRRGAFSSFPLPLILRHLLLAPSPPPPPRHPPPRPPCPGWLSRCRWMKGRTACGVTRPGWAPGDWSLWWRPQHLDLREKRSHLERFTKSHIPAKTGRRWVVK